MHIDRINKLIVAYMYHEEVMLNINLCRRVSYHQEIVEQLWCSRASHPQERTTVSFTISESIFRVAPNHDFVTCNNPYALDCSI